MSPGRGSQRSKRVLGLSTGLNGDLETGSPRGPHNAAEAIT